MSEDRQRIEFIRQVISGELSEAASLESEFEKYFLKDFDKTLVEELSIDPLMVSFFRPERKKEEGHANAEYEVCVLLEWCCEEALKVEQSGYDIKRFVKAFLYAMISSYEDYVKKKARAWKKENTVSRTIQSIVWEYIRENYVLVVGLGIFGGIALFMEWLDVVAAIVTSSLIGSTIMVPVKKAQDNEQRRHETWVRHSSRYYRLELAMREFNASKRTAKDFDLFARKTFYILERNIDQFELNMSGNGIVENFWPYTAPEGGQ